MINDDPNRVIEFDPTDVTFAERFYDLLKKFQEKLADIQERSNEIEMHTETDENGIPLNVGDRIALIHEICAFARERIDYLFGAGTSQTAFGDALSPEAISQFFDGMTPFIRAARDEKVLKYTNANHAGRVMK